MPQFLYDIGVQIPVHIRDAAGADEANLTYQTAGLNVSVWQSGSGSVTRYEVDTSGVEAGNVGSYAAPTEGCCRIIAVSSTDFPGLYVLDFESSFYIGADNLYCRVWADDGSYDSGTKEVPLKGVVQGATLSGAYDAAKTAAQAGTALSTAVWTGTKAGYLDQAISAKRAVSLAAGDVSGNLPADVQTIKGQAVTCAAGVTVGVYVGSTAAASTHTPANVASLILASPTYKIITDSDGYVACDVKKMAAQTVSASAGITIYPILGGTSQTDDSYSLTAGLAPSGGSGTFTVDGVETGSVLGENYNSSTVQAAIEAVVGTGNVSVTGTPQSLLVTFTGGYSGRAVSFSVTSAWTPSTVVAAQVQQASEGSVPLTRAQTEQALKDVADDESLSTLTAQQVWEYATRTLSAFGFSVIVGTNNDKTNYTLAADSITASTFDESTAFPLKSADTGSTKVARTGADSDTLETLSDQIDIVEDAVSTGTITVTSNVNVAGDRITLTHGDATTILFTDTDDSWPSTITSAYFSLRNKNDELILDALDCTMGTSGGHKTCTVPILEADWPDTRTEGYNDHPYDVEFRLSSGGPTTRILGLATVKKDVTRDSVGT